MSNSFEDLSLQMYKAQALAIEKEQELQKKNEDNLRLKEEVKSLRQRIAETIPDPVTSLLIFDKKEQNSIIFNSKAGKFQNISLRPPSNFCTIDITAVIDGEIYVIDGLVQECFKLKADGKWQKMAELNERRSNISNSHVVYKNELWVIGGRFYDNPSTSASLNSVEKYDALEDKWIQMPPMNIRRDSAAATVINGRIFISGGKNGDEELNSLEVFDFCQQKWVLFCETPVSLSSHLMLSDEDELIIFEERCTPPSAFTKAGRIFLNGALMITSYVARVAEGVRREIDYYDTQEATPIVVMWKLNVNNPSVGWKEVAGNQKYRMKFGAVKLENKMVFFGGRDSYDYHQLDSVDIFDGNRWTAGPKLPQRMADFSFVTKAAFSYSGIPQSLEEFLINKFIY